MEQLPELVRDIMAAMRREHPGLEFLTDENGRPRVALAIRVALGHFVRQLTEDSETPPELHEFFMEFGRNQARSGRNLNVLQSIFRLSVRLAWRSLADIGQSVGIPPPAMYELAESVLEYLDELVSHSVRGYAEVAVDQAGERIQRQRALIDLLLTEHRSDPSAAMAAQAAAVDWPLPGRVAAALLLRPARESVPPVLSGGVLIDAGGEQARLVVPDPDGPGAFERLARATGGWSGAVGPAVPLTQAAVSLHWAAAAVGMMKAGLLPNGRLLRCSDHAEALVLMPACELIDDLGRRRLAQLSDLSAVPAGRLAETLLAWLETQGSAPAVADRLGVHPQTVRNRMRQIRDLWGEELDDPERRFELELVLRVRRMRAELGEAKAD
ncbi:helix-turn-helix domain-containing protein [Streptomyces chartreusis]|uniref:PucR family transcriptional regulator n=1 Tax=Streptomyces chartreusis TaxID=1969 RepID=UPI0033ED8808